MRCLDDNTIALLADGLLGEAQRARADAHIDECERCRDLVVGIVRSTTTPMQDSMASDMAQTRRDRAANDRPSQPPSSRAPLVWRKDDIIAQYRILRHLGRGGAGEVYVARDTRLGRRVALKTLRAFIHSEAAAARFMREAQITAKLNHPNIVTIYEVAQHSGTPFLALEYVHGRSLHDRLKEERWPSAQESVRIALAVAEALVHAHRHGVLHRDLKPGNIVIDREGRVRVVDFGLAETVAIDDPLTGDDDVPLSVRPTVDEVEGTPLYMAPEQWRGDASSTATDVWALGVVLYLLVAHKHPFSASNMTQLSRSVCGAEPATWGDEVDTVVELEETVMRCLRKDPAERPSAAEVLEVLRVVVSAPRHAAVTQDSPYRGLLTFRERDAGLFFGREEEIASFVERLRVHPVLPVVGPSGAGKSSFIEAGVVPRLREQRPWLIVRVRPRSDPFLALASALLRADSGATSGSGSNDVGLDSGGSTTKRALAERLRDAPGELAVELLGMARRHGADVLLFVDQLEEAFTLVSDDDTLEHFVRAVCSAADDDLDPVRVVFTLRDDFVVRLAELQEGRHALTQLTIMNTPSEAALAEILEGPALVVGYHFDDPDLVPEMIASLRGERACLPLMEFAAQELWERRDKKRRMLLRSAYDELGGVAGALVRHADGVIDGLSQAELLTARQLLLRLVTPDRTRRVVRASEALEGLGERGADIVERFTRARLLSVTRSKGQSTEDALVELVHGSLIHRWTRLSRWIDESHEELVFLEEVSDAAEIWSRRGRPPEALWTGDQLHDAVRRLSRATTSVSEAVRAFVDAGEQRRRRRLRRLRLAVAALVASLASIAAVATYVAFYVDQQRDRAESFSAQSLLEGARGAYAQGANLEARAKLRMALEIKDSVGARALWWQLSADPLLWRKQIGAPVFGVDISPSTQYVATASQNGAVYLIDRETRTTRLLRGHRDQVIGVAFSPDGTRVASGALDRTVRIWNTTTGKVERVLEGHESGVHGVAFSPDGALVAAGGEDHSVRVWQVDSGASKAVFRGHLGVVRSVAFSPDGAWLASAGGDHDVRLWSLRDDKAHQVLKGHEREVYSVAFSGDGKWLASASFDHSVRLWHAGSGKAGPVLRGHQSSATGVRFSADNTRVIAAGVDGAIHIFDVKTGQRVGTLREASTVWGIGLSRDGRLLATATGSDGVALWDLTLQGQQAAGEGHGEAVTAVDFAAGDTAIASAGLDQTIRMWSVKTGAQERTMHVDGAVRTLALNPKREQLAASFEGGTIHLWDLDSTAEPKLLRGHSNQVHGLRFSDDGRFIASASFDGTVRVWNSDSGDAVAVLGEGGAHRMRAAAFDAQAKRVVSASDDGMVRVYDVASASLEHELSGHDGRVYDVSFSPDGKWIVSTGWDGTIRLWSTDSGRGEILGRHEGRVYGLCFHPDSKHVATASADRSVRIWDISDKSSRVLRGHRNEVNAVRFSHDGKLLASGSDDGTVRLWQLDPLQPAWFGAGWMGSPPQLLTHEGWRSLDGDGTPQVPSTAIAAMARREARQLEVSADGTKLCVRGRRDMLSLWNVTRDELVFSRPIGDLERMVATDDGCATLAKGKAVLHTTSGEEIVLDASPPITAIAADGRHVLVAGATGIEELDEHGQSVARHPAGSGVSAIWRSDHALLAGYRDGNIELIAGPGQTSTAVPFERVPDSEVVSLALGPQSTVIAGYANGALGMWDTHDGSRLAVTRIHGPVTHLALVEHHVNAASDLGRATRWDLETFHQDHCEVLRQVWSRVPVVWDNGQAKLRPVPGNHPCSPP